MFGSVDYRGSTGTVSIYYDPLTPTTFGGSQVPNRINLQRWRVDGDASQLTAYMLVNTVADLELVGTNLNAANLRARQEHRRRGTNPSPPPYPGLSPASSTATAALASIPRSTNLSVGLFSTIGNVNGAGTVRNLNLTNVAINASSGTVGALAGTNHGAISNVAVAGSVSGSNGSLVGGVVGDNFGSITNSSAAGSFSGGTTSIVGGLAAVNEIGSSVSGSFSGGAVSILSGSAGGLVGSSGGSITDSYSMAAVSGQPTTVWAASSASSAVAPSQRRSQPAACPAAGAGAAGGLVGSSNAGTS